MAKPRTSIPAVGVAALTALPAFPAVLQGRISVRAGGMFPTGSSGTNATFWAVLGVLLLVTVLIVGFLVFNRRREVGSGAGTAPQMTGAEGPSLQELGEEAAQLLTETNEAAKAGEQELDATIARYGPDGASYAAATLAEAKGRLAEAFHLRGRLEAQPAPQEAELREILRQVIHKCGEANAALEAHFAALEQLREQ